MIKKLLLASLLLSTMVLHAQNFELVKVNTHVSFLDSVNAFSQFVRPIKVIQNSFNGDLQVFDIKFDTGNCNRPTSILGTKIEKTLTNNYLLYNNNLDTITINTFGNLNDFWKSYKYQDGSYIEAKITDISSKNFLGVSDMCKTITFTKKDQNDMDVLHPINGLEIIISQNYGLIQTVNFLNFPENVTDANFALYGDVVLNPSKLNLTSQEIYDFQLGDVFHYIVNTYGPSFPCTTSFQMIKADSVIAKNISQNLDTISYTVISKSYSLYQINGNIDDGCEGVTQTFTNDTIIKKVIFSNLDNLNIESAGKVDYSMQYLAKGDLDLYRFSNQFTASTASGCLYQDPCVVDTYSSSTTYKRGLGMTNDNYSYSDDCAGHSFSHDNSLVYTNDVSDSYSTPVDFCSKYYDGFTLSQSFNTLYMSNSIEGDLLFNWYLNGQLDTSTAINHYSPSQNGTYILEIIYDNCVFTSQPFDFLIVPVANFTYSSNNVCTGTEVYYSNNSTGNPDTFSWYFEGGIPNTSSDENPVVIYPSPGIFNVSLMVTNNAGSDEKVLNNFLTINDCASLITPTTSEINIYPNPTEGILYFLIDSNDYVEYEINDLSGKIVSPKTNLKNSVDISNFDEGSYLIKFYSNSNTFSRRFVKK